MTRSEFDLWLAAYGRAWEQKDTDAFTRLFTSDIEYFWTPFSEPKRGRDGVAKAFEEAVSNQEDISFRWKILGGENDHWTAQWHTELTRLSTGKRVQLDGVLTIEVDPEDLCRVFREWWHSDEE